MILEEDEFLGKQFSKNKFVIKGNVAEMSIYDLSYREKRHKVLVDKEDIPLLEEIRWREDGEGRIVTGVRKGKRNLTLNLMDYIMYVRYGIKSPLYHPNCNNADCRKLNIRIKKDKRRELSTVRNII
jgi:hypothetical protein